MLIDLRLKKEGRNLRRGDDEALEFRLIEISSGRGDIMLLDGVLWFVVHSHCVCCGCCFFFYFCVCCNGTLLPKVGKEFKAVFRFGPSGCENIYLRVNTLFWRSGVQIGHLSRD